MAALWEGAHFGQAAALYDASGQERLPVEATILRARAYLKVNEAPSAINLLEGDRKNNAAPSAQRSLVLASAYARVGNYGVADELFAEAEAAACRQDDPDLLDDIAYARAKRYLFEQHPEQARELLARVRLAKTTFGQLRALHLESFLLRRESRHHDQARVLMELLGRIDPHRTDYMEIRAWATQTLAALARELYIPEALSAIDRQLGGVEWPSDFDTRRFLTLKALGWAYALRGDYFNAFRFLKLSSKKATTDAWRAIAAADRAQLARCKREHLWSRQELAEAEDYAANVNWDAVRDESRLGLLLLAELFVPIDAARASYYEARFNEHGNITRTNYYLKNDPRLKALAQYSAAIVSLSVGHRKVGLDLLRKALQTFGAHGYGWRAGQCALKLYEETHDVVYAAVAKEHLRFYAGSWLGDELRAMVTPAIKLPPMQKRVYEALCKGYSTAQIASEIGRSQFTIRNHIKLIFKALGVNSRAALIASSQNRTT